MEEHHHLYNTFRRFPELAKSFKAAEGFGDTTSRRNHSYNTNQKSWQQLKETTYMSEVYCLQRKLKDLKGLNCEETEKLNGSWSQVREMRKEKRPSSRACTSSRNSRMSSSKNSPLIDRKEKGSNSVTEASERNPSESALHKLIQSGFPGITVETGIDGVRSYTFYTAGFLAVLGIPQRRSVGISETFLQSQLLNILGVSLNEEETKSFLQILLQNTSP
jgi:hypothetical protein